MIGIIAAVTTAVGLAVGWTVRGSRNNSGESREDWKTRLATRDQDLHDARDQLAAAAVEAQAAGARAHAAEAAAAELRAETESLRQHAGDRDREIERLEDLVIDLQSRSDTSPREELEAAQERIASLQARIDDLQTASNPAIEELESELATLTSSQCPDPAVHRPAETSWTEAPVLDSAVPEPVTDWVLDDELPDEFIDDDLPLAPVVSLRPLGPESDDVAVAAPDLESPTLDEPDDLTAIKGIGPKIATTLTRMGIGSYRDLVLLGQKDSGELAEMLNGLLSRLERGNWVEAAAELHLEKYGERL